MKTSPTLRRSPVVQEMAPPVFEALERRELLSSVTMGPDLRAFTFTDFDGDQVTVKLQGPGEVQIAEGSEESGTSSRSLIVLGAGKKTQLTIKVRAAEGGDGSVSLGGLSADSLGRLVFSGVSFDAGRAAAIAGDLGSLQIAGDSRNFRLTADTIDSVRVKGAVATSVIASAGSIRSISIGGAMTDGSSISAGGDVGSVRVAGDLRHSQILAGARLGADGSLVGGAFRIGHIQSVQINGASVDSIIAAGGDPGADAVFELGEVTEGGSIGSIRIDGSLSGGSSQHPNPGVYAATIGKVLIAGNNLTGHTGGSELSGVDGAAVLDPLPAPGIALSEPEIRRIFEQSIARASQLGVNATISLVDREGNILGVVRMTDGSLAADPGVSTISAGGIGGLEGVTVASSLTATSKAGTAAFLSTSGNAFSTRTAGFIIQSHFPGNVRYRPGGPLFGVQFSSLPTSDINRLPLGLAADPGGVPLYREGQVIAGIGVELDGLYTAPGSDPVGKSRVTLEEQIAVAGQAGLEAPKKIRATRIFVEGLRLALKEAKTPKVASLGALPDFLTLEAEGRLDVLVAPQVSPPSMFTAATVAGVNGETVLREGGTLTIAGAVTGGQQLTSGDVQQILTQAHELNSRLRAQIRKDRPQTSQVSVSVVDTEGNVLGTFRTGDAPVFGFDVSVQKARTAAFFSRPDAGDLLRAAEGGAFASYADRAAAFGVALDGSVAIADRTGGFLSRPFFPDGIPGNGPGPFAANAPERFSPFNTGLQTALLTTNLVGFLTDFAAVGDEGMALAQFDQGLIGGGGVASATLPLRNGMQIFPGSVPLYKNGVLVGAVGVSGDGIEQDDFVAFTGATGYQSFGAGVRRADEVMVMGVRLPYVKLPRSPFGGR